MEQLCDIGVAGLAVMGANLARNIASRKYKVAVINRTRLKTDEFMSHYASEGIFEAPGDVQKFVNSLAKPRKIILMVKAGSPVDEFIEYIIPYLEPGDIVVDGGNSYYADTARREIYLAGRGIHFVGCGISGGEEGALHGPAMMPGGSHEAWRGLEDIFCSIAAKAPDGTPCCAWIGSGGSGHFVKTVHNGIEYADMQLIAEAYKIMRDSLGMTSDEIGDVFEKWNKGALSGFLMETAAKVMKTRDAVTGRNLVEMVLDSASQKGTGKWTAQAAFELGVPASMIAQSVFARFVSAMKSERLKASKIIGDTLGDITIPKQNQNKEIFCAHLEKAIYAAKICAYAQGFAILHAASEKYSWKLDYEKIASIWRGGCIIRAAFLEEIMIAFKVTKSLENLLLAPFFTKLLKENISSLREIVVFAVRSGISAACFADALSYFDSYRDSESGANIIQAMRDSFGAHTFVRTDDPDKKNIHIEW